MRILAIDPGVTSAYVLIDTETLTVEWASVWRGMEQLHRLYVDGLFNNLDIVVIEDYRVYPNRASSHVGASLHTARVIGRIEWIAHTQGIELVEQPASQAKQRWPDSRMKQVGFKARGGVVTGMQFKSKHIRDAFRHALTYMEKNNVVRLSTKGRRVS